MERRWLGIDLGTQGVRASVHGDDGRTLATGGVLRPPRTPVAGAMIHLPEPDWYEAAMTTARAALAGSDPGSVAGIAIGGLFPGVVLVGKDGPCSDGLLYADRRGAEARAALAERGGRPLAVDDVAVRLAWLAATDPDAVREARWALGPGGYLAWRLTAQPSLDPASASRWGLADPENGAWDRDAADRMGIPPRLLPPVTAAAAPVGTLTPDAAAALGLAPGTPVVAGTTDSLCLLLAAGVTERGGALLNYGTTGTLLVVTRDLDVALDDPRIPAVGDPYRRVAHLSGSGLFLELVRTELLAGADVAELDAAAGAVPAGADGLTALPWVGGRVMPRQAPHLRAGFVGLTVGNTRGHVWRAALEGCAFALADAAAVDPQGRQLRVVTAGGGGSRSPVWRAIVSDVTGWRQSIAPAGGTARGAALLAAHGVGGGAIRELARTWLAAAAGDGTASTESDPARHAVYRPLLERWRRLDRAIGDALAP